MSKIWVIIAILAVFLAGCGTTHTVGRSDADVRRSLQNRETHCSEMPRIYSGVAYNSCRVYSRQWLGDPRNGLSVARVPSEIPFWLFDFGLSAVLDTIALPYTFYTQIKYGNYDLK